MMGRREEAEKKFCRVVRRYEAWLHPTRRDKVKYGVRTFLSGLSQTVAFGPGAHVPSSTDPLMEDRSLSGKEKEIVRTYVAHSRALEDVEGNLEGAKKDQARNIREGYLERLKDSFIQQYLTRGQQKP